MNAPADPGAAVEAVLLDLYDTLIRADPQAIEAGRLALAERAGVDAALLREQFQRTREARVLGTLGGLEEQLAAVLGACGPALDAAAVRDLAAFSFSLWHSSVRPFDDVLPCLGELRQRGVRLAMVSNCSPDAGSVVRALGLEPLFDAVVLSCEVGLAKPDPAILQAALERLGGVPAERALFVDDLPANLDAARTIGLRTALIVRYDQAVDDPSGHPRITSLWPVVSGRW